MNERFCPYGFGILATEILRSQLEQSVIHIHGVFIQFLIHFHLAPLLDMSFVTGIIGTITANITIENSKKMLQNCLLYMEATMYMILKPPFCNLLTLISICYFLFLLQSHPIGAKLNYFKLADTPLCFHTFIIMLCSQCYKLKTLEYYCPWSTGYCVPITERGFLSSIRSFVIYVNFSIAVLIIEKFRSYFENTFLRSDW